MSQPKVGPPSLSPRTAALYSDMLRRPAAPPLSAPQPTPRVLIPLQASTSAHTQPHAAAALPRPVGPVRPASAATFRNLRQLLLALAQQLSLQHGRLLQASTLADLTREDKGYCIKLKHLDRAFADILAATNNFTANLEHLHEDTARLLAAHLQHGRALLENPALVMTDNPSYKSFSAPAGERPEPVLLKVPLSDRATWLPTSHKFLHLIATRCPLPSLTRQVAQFYRAMADLVEARERSSEQDTLKRMFGQVAHNWRDYSDAIESRPWGQPR